MPKPDLKKSALRTLMAVHSIPEELVLQVEELVHRASTAVVDPAVRMEVLEDARELLNEIGSDETALDGDAIISDNEDDGYWVTCRVFVSYREI
jgi:hypothetical protein